MLPLLAIALFAIPPRSCCPSMNAFAADPAFVASHLAPLPFKFQGREGKMLDFPDSAGGMASAYYVPPKGGVRTAILMVHEWWGLNDYIKREAVRLHNKLGYGVLAVDLYGGQVAATPDEAGKLMAGVDPAKCKAIVGGAVQSLTDGVFGTKFNRVGTIGWCFGGGYSLQAAIAGGDRVQACVMYYGMPDDDPAQLARLKAPVLLVEALEDKWISPEVVAKFKASMHEAHRSLAVRTYEADHAFANPSNPKYMKGDAEDAMAATLRFFRSHLG
jgi:carboxymethylenebutenolidase